MSEPTPPPAVKLTAPDGSLVEADAPNLDALLSAGYRPTTADEESAFAKRQGYDSQDGRTFLEGVARGGTLGLSDAVQAGGAGAGTRIGNWFADKLLGNDGLDMESATADREQAAQNAIAESKADILGRQQTNKVAAGLGEATGGIGLGLATGGLGTSAAAGAGLRAAGATAEGLGLLGRVGLATATGAGEGAVFGAAKAANDDFLVDREITAERMLLGAGEGALLGGAFGGGATLLGAGAKALYTGGKKLVGGIGQRVLGRGAVDGADDALAASIATKTDDELRALADADASAGVSGRLGANIDDATHASTKIDVDSTLAQSIEEATNLSNSVDGEATANMDMVFEPVYQQRGALITSELADVERTKAARIFAQARASEGGFEAAQQKAVRDIGTKGDRIMEIADEINERAGIAAKRRAADKLNGWGRPVSSPETQSVFDKFGEQLDGLAKYRSAINEGGGAATVKQLKLRLKDARESFAEAMHRGDIGDAAMVLDDLKRSADKAAANTRNRIVQTALQGESGVNGANDLIRKHLENVDVFGDFALAQKPVNATWAETIRRSKDDMLRGILYEGGESGANPWNPLKKMNRESLGGLLRRLGDAEVEPKEAAFRKWVRSLEMDAKNRANAWGDDRLQNLADELGPLVDDVEAHMNAVGLSRRDAEAWKQLTKDVDVPGPVGWALQGGATVTQKLAGLSESTGSRVIESKLGQNISGGASAGSTRSVGLTAEMSADARASAIARAELERRADVVASARKAAQRGEERLDSAATGLLKTTRAGSGATPERIAQAISVAGVLLNPRDPKSYEKTIDNLMRLQDANSEERQRLRDRNMELASESPEHAQAIDAMTQATADFLLDKAGPSGIDVTKPFAHLRGPKHDPQKAIALARYARAAQNPGGALERVAEGKHTREDIETLKTLYPRLWTRFGAKVQAQLASLKKPPTYRARVMLSQVLGQPMTDFDTPQFQAQIAAARGTSDVAEQQRSAPKLSMLGKSMSDGVAGSDQALARGE